MFPILQPQPDPLANVEKILRATAATLAVFVLILAVI